jgi:hypothetical protein
MPILEGTHRTGSGDRTVQFHVDYEVHGNTVHFKATFSGARGPSTREGEFDFDRARVDPASAVDAFMQNHIGKDDFEGAP